MRQQCISRIENKRRSSRSERLRVRTSSLLTGTGQNSGAANPRSGMGLSQILTMIISFICNACGPLMRHVQVSDEFSVKGQGIRDMLLSVMLAARQNMIRKADPTYDGVARTRSWTLDTDSYSEQRTASKAHHSSAQLNN